MRKVFLTASLAVLAALVALPVAQAQRYESTPVDLSEFLNVDGWYHDDADDPGVPTTDPSGEDAVWGLDDGGARIKITTLPADVVPGQINVTDDGEVAFLLPAMNIGDLDAYYPDGSLIPVPAGSYRYLYLAVMSGNGNWPGSFEDWQDEIDPETGEILIARPENNAFTPVYEDGESDPIQIGLVNDWFWSPPEWVAPESGDAGEIIVDYMTYEGDVDYFFYFVDGVNQANHNYGQNTYLNGEGYFIYALPVPDGLTEATLYTEMWGNVKMSISNGDFSDDAGYTEIFNSVDSDQAYPGGGDGYEPNRDIRSHDISDFLDTEFGEIYLKFEDAAPGQLNQEGESDAFGPRVHQLGVFTGSVVRTSIGERLWPGLVRTDGASPSGGLILIKKKYLLDETKTLTAIQMPTNIPRSDPFLTVFGITLANEGTGVNDFMLY
ncbi:MAG: hypothetical protein JXR73_20280 [Candidatus Omnitrophica bacterium]|nr:hypothetical protein [Candidatus Omnitrophota bacterium]